jgi:serine/threonine protein kinase
MDQLENKCIWPGWETVRLIGRGSYGVVYEIRRTIAGEEERAAVKCLSIPSDESEIKELRISCRDEDSIVRRFFEQKERVVREYSTMARLKGASHIVYCDDIRTEPHADGIGWDIFIRMELLIPLADVLQGPMEEKDILRLGKDITKALLSCHKENIIHRDVKPQNIFVNREGEYKLGDFGVARSMEGTGSASVRTGTYRYMAPEIFNGERYGPKADLYSLGLVLYWLLNERRLPFLAPEIKLPTADEEKQSCLRRFRGEPLPPPATGSEGFRRVVLKACAFDPRERYLSAEEMLEALEELSIRSRRRPPDEGRADRGEWGRSPTAAGNRPAAPVRQPARPPVQRRPAEPPAGKPDRQRPEQRDDAFGFHWQEQAEPAAGAGKKPERRNRRFLWLLAAIGFFSVLLGVLLVFVLRGGREEETETPPAGETSAAEPTETPVPDPSEPPELPIETSGEVEEPSAPDPEIPQYTRQQVIDGARSAAENIEGYNTSSATGASLEVPQEKDFLSSPFRMLTKSSRGANGNIYIMPRPDSNDNGHLGQLPHGLPVTVLAEQNGYYFFVTQDGRAGWNGKKFFSEP